MQTGDGGERPDPADSFETVIRGKPVVIEIIHHAADRMRDRGITRDQVVRCPQFPDQRGLDADGGRERDARHDPDGLRRLNVVYEVTQVPDGPTVITVVSAFWDSRGRR